MIDKKEILAIKNTDEYRELEAPGRGVEGEVFSKGGPELSTKIYSSLSYDPNKELVQRIYNEITKLTVKLLAEKTGSSMKIEKLNLNFLFWVETDNNEEHKGRSKNTNAEENLRNNLYNQIPIDKPINQYGDLSYNPNLKVSISLEETQNPDYRFIQKIRNKIYQLASEILKESQNNKLENEKLDINIKVQTAKWGPQESNKNLWEG